MLYIRHKVFPWVAYITSSIAADGLVRGGEFSESITYKPSRGKDTYSLCSDYVK